MRVYIVKDSHDILAVFDARELAVAYENGDCDCHIEEWEVDSLVTESICQTVTQ